MNEFPQKLSPIPVDSYTIGLQNLNNYNDLSVIQGVGIDGIELVSFLADYTPLHEHVIVSKNHLDDEDTRYKIATAPDCIVDNVLVTEGSVGPFHYSRYYNGRVKLSGSPSRLLYEGFNSRLLSPYEFNTALVEFEKRYDTSLKEWHLRKCEIALNVLSSYSLEAVIESMGSFKGKSLRPYTSLPGCQSNVFDKHQSPDPSTFYFLGGSSSTSTILTDSLKIYDKGLQLENKGEVLNIPEEHNFLRIERAFRSRLTLGGQSKEIFEEFSTWRSREFGYHPSKGAMNFRAADLNHFRVIEYLVSRFVKSIMDIGKKNLVPRRIEDVSGRTKVIGSERGLALSALKSYESAFEHPDGAYRTKEHFLRLQRRHADIMNQDSVWGELLSNLYEYTWSAARGEWERFFRLWNVKGTGWIFD